MDSFAGPCLQVIANFYADDTIETGLSIVRYTNQFQATNLGDIADILHREKFIHGSDAPRPEFVSLGHVNGYQTIVAFKEYGTNKVQKSLDTIVEINGKVYSIDYFTESPDVYYKYLPTIKQMLDSLQEIPIKP